MRYQQFTFWLITFEQSVRKLKYLCLWIPCVVPNQKMSIMPGLIEPPVGHFEMSYIFISSEPFNISSQKSVGIIYIMSWTYHRSMKTAPPTVREILRSLKKCITFKICLKFVLLMSFCSLGYADSENVSFVIFQNSVCPPYWSKWTTVFSLLLLENLSNSSQNCSDDLWIELNRTC